MKSNVEIAVRVVYFAMLRESTGAASETVRTASLTPRDLYEELRKRYGWKLPAGVVRAAVNGAYAPMNTPLQEGDELAFIPPVAGG